MPIENPSLILAQKSENSEKPANPEKSQEELRAILEQKLKSLKLVLQEGVKEYEQALNDGVFEDIDGEPNGNGEARKETLQKRLTDLIGRAKRMKVKLDSKETLPQYTEEIQAVYTLPDGKKETITLNLETKLQDFLAFYQKTTVDLPPDFEDSVHDIWDRNQTEIEQAIEQNGFNDMLVIPGNIPLKDLAKKMEMGKGYNFYQVQKDFSDVTSKNTDKPRIILYHHMDSLPEIAQKTGLDIHLNITGGEAKKLYEANPDKYLATLEDAIILERQYFEKTGKHLSDWTQKSAHWLPGTRVGARLVDSYWNPDTDHFNVGTLDLALRFDSLGLRSARCFF